MRHAWLNEHLWKAREEIENAWEAWPKRKDPPSTQNMFLFYMTHEDRDILFWYREHEGDQVWQEIKYWLIDYERSCGRWPGTRRKSPSSILENDDEQV